MYYRIMPPDLIPFCKVVKIVSMGNIPRVIPVMVHPVIRVQPGNRISSLS